MNEFETNLDIVIRSVVDEASAKKAPQEISKIILGVLKDGYIEIPTTISTEFDKTKVSSELIKAQKDFITQWGKMSKEGFSSSQEDLQSFIDKYIELKRLIGKEHQAGSKQNLALKGLHLDEVVQAYKKATDNVDKQLIKSSVKTSKVNNAKVSERKQVLKESPQMQAILSSLDIISNFRNEQKDSCRVILEQIRDITQSINNKIIGKIDETFTHKANAKEKNNLSLVDSKQNIKPLLPAIQQAFPLMRPLLALPAPKPMVIPGQTAIQNFKYDIPKGATRGSKLSTETLNSNDTLDSYINLFNAQKDREKREQQRGALSRSIIQTTLKDPAKWAVRLKDTFADLTHTTAQYKKVVAATSKEQDKMAADRIKRYGFDRGRNTTGDKILMARDSSLWRGRDRFKELFKELKLTEGINIDTTEVTDKLGKVLTSRQWRNAQLGGSPLRQVAGAFTGFIGMPSVEKSRAAADALNQINANIRETLNKTLTDIQNKESALAGMVETGDLKLDTEGRVLEGSTSEAKTLVAQLENTKLILDSILADMGDVDNTIQKSHGNIGKIVKQLSFTSPALRQNNAIVNNINAGFDKSGKALRFQTRTAEILNTTLRLINRHVGQTLRNFIFMISPINIVKKTFTDFMSYDIKWKRTMNVIKYNLRSVLKPFVEWIAQRLVNIIGFVDIISMKIQSAFGHTPISLFDQMAADAEKTAEEIQSVTAGFDELHDIGSDSTGENDLFGEIYKPELPKEWEDLANKIGDLFAGLIKGDLGFGEVMGTILDIIWSGLKTLAKTIWEWFKQTAIGKYLTEHWKDILANILGAFLAWKLLKVAGKLLWSALFDNFNAGSIGKVFSNIGNWITKALGVTAFGRGILEAFSGVLTGSTGLLTTLKSIFVGHEAITAFGAWGETLGALFVQGIGVALGGAAVIGGYGITANDASYNLGLDAYGGKNSDKKSGIGGKALGTLGGAALGAFLVGGPIAIGIGAIAGLIVTSLAPAFEQLAVSAKNANNEMQKIEYYEGAVQGAQTQVSELDELMQVMSNMLQAQIEKVYKVGDELGITRIRMDELVSSVSNGTFSTEMLTGAEIGLTDSLTQLSSQYEKNEDMTKRLTEAKRTLQKAELDLAIAQDIEAGHFEMAAARVEYALASELYETDEAAKKMTQIMKKASAEQQAAMLKDMSPDMKKNFDNYYLTTKGAMDELYKLYDKMSDKERETWLQNINSEIADNIRSRMETIKQRVQNSSWWQQLLDINKNGKLFGISYIGHDIPGYATGTNYVPNDGLAYLHQGEAVIPKKYNQPYQQTMSTEEMAYMQQMMSTMKSLDNTMRQGISVNGEFRQRGSDLVAVVNKTKSQTGADVLSNVAYAR